MRTSTLLIAALAAFLAAVPDHSAAQTPTIRSQVYATFERAGGVTELVGLAVGDVPPGAQVTINCSGTSCPFSTKVLNISGNVKILAITDMFVETNFRPGTIIEVRVTKPGAVGKVYQYEILSSEDPKVTRQCLPPGSSKPINC